MKRSLVPALCLFLAILARADEAPRLASLSGTVVKEPGDQPLKKVLLHLIAEDQKQGGNYTADTDPEGRFRIAKIVPGRYRLLIEKTGFHPINPRGHRTEGSVLALQPGQEIADVVFQMLPAAVITGKVVDEDGDPLPSYGVTLLKKRPGKSRQPEVAAEDRTNDLGEYRFGGLFPGQYFVAVVPPPDMRNFVRSANDPSESESKPDLNYQVTYYPGVNDSTQASAIDLRAGDEMPVNFALVPARTHRIRGIVTGIPANQKSMVQLISKGVTQTMNAADVSADGQFEIRGVAPGSYVAVVFAGSDGQILTDRQNITVVAADVEGVKLVPARPFIVSGHVRFEGQWPRDATQCAAYLRSADHSEDEGVSFVGPGMSAAQVDRFGNFKWTDVNPGNYVAQFSGGDAPGTFLKSVTIGNAPADTGLNITGPTSVELVVSSKGGMLEGAVLDQDKPAPNATVVVAPEEKYRKLRDRFGTGTTDQNGHFTIRGLAPGAYTVFAWQDLDESLYYDDAFLKSQESNGTALKVEEGARHKIELTLSSVGDEWQ